MASVLYDPDPERNRQAGEEIEAYCLQEEIKRLIPRVEKRFQIRFPACSYVSWEDFTSAFADILMKKAEQGDVDFQYLVGCICSGRNEEEWFVEEEERDLYAGFSAEKEEAVKWFQRAGEAGHVKAMLCLAELTFSDDLPLSVKWYEKAAEAGNIGAMTRLANIWLFDGRAEHDSLRAKEWLERADAMISQEEGYRDRMVITETYYLLGSIYENGDGTVKRDLEKAIRCYKELFKRIKKEGFYYNRVEEQEYWTHSEDADLDYVTLYQRQIGRNLGSEDEEHYYPDGSLLVNRLIDRHYFEFDYYIGLIYEWGLFGVQPDMEKAVSFYEAAWWMGWPEYRLGYLYEKGIKTERDQNQALHWYRKCAQMYYEHLSEESYDWYFSERIFS